MDIRTRKVRRVRGNRKEEEQESQKEERERCTSPRNRVCYIYQEYKTSSQHSYPCQSGAQSPHHEKVTAHDCNPEGKSKIVYSTPLTLYSE